MLIYNHVQLKPLSKFFVFLEKVFGLISIYILLYCYISIPLKHTWAEFCKPSAFLPVLYSPLTNSHCLLWMALYSIPQ